VIPALPKLRGINRFHKFRISINLLNAHNYVQTCYSNINIDLMVDSYVKCSSLHELITTLLSVVVGSLSVVGSGNIGFRAGEESLYVFLDFRDGVGVG